MNQTDYALKDYKADAARFNEWVDQHTYWKEHKQTLRDILDASIEKKALQKGES